MKSTVGAFCAVWAGSFALFAGSDSLRVTPLAAEKGVAFEVVTDIPCMGANWKAVDSAGKELKGFAQQRHAGQTFVIRVPDVAAGKVDFSAQLSDGNGGPWIVDSKPCEWLSSSAVCAAPGAATKIERVAADAAAPRIKDFSGKLFGWIDGGKTAFEKGEKIRFRFHANADVKELSFHRWGDDRIDETVTAANDGTGDLVYETSMAKPGAVSVEAKFPQGMLMLSAMVAFEEIKGNFELRPADFDAFWDGIRKQAKASLAQARVEPKGKGRFVVTIPCGAAQPMVMGYAVAEDAAAKSCVADFDFPGYNPTFSAGVPMPVKGRILCSLSVHGSPIGMPGDYYQQFAVSNKLNQYGFEPERNRNRETTYFHDMALRLVTALEYVKTLPQWSGEMSVHGGSQGGFLSLTAAGVEPSVKTIAALYPWMCDIDSDVSGYYGGWHPHYTPALAYYNPVFHAANLKPDQKLESCIGLADITCTPYGIAAVFNAVKGPKSIKVYQAAWHCGPSRNAKLDFAR